MSKRGEPEKADDVEEGELEEGETIEEDDQQQQDEQRNSWLFTSAEMATDRPSLRDGMSPAQEDAARLKGVLLIQNLGVMLRIPMHAITSAIVFFHRFYMRRSFRTFDYHDFAAGCLFLACKLADVHIRFKEFLRTCIKKMARREVTDIPEKDFERWKKTILFAEEYIGVSLCYDLEVDNDFSFFLKTSSELQGMPSFVLGKLNRVNNVNLKAPPPVAQLAWTIMNDSYRTTLCLRYPIPSILAASWLLAFSVTPTEWSKDSFKKRFSSNFSDLDENALKDIMKELVTQYEQAQV